MSDRWDMIVVAIVLAPFVALGAALYALAWGVAAVWRLSRGVTRDMTLLALVEHARAELDEDRAARRELAGKAWRGEEEAE